MAQTCTRSRTRMMPTSSEDGAHASIERSEMNPLACGLQVKVAQHLRFFTRSQLVWSSVSQTLPRPAIWWASCARQVRPCELTTGPSTFTHGSERGLAPHPAPSDRHGQGACGPALGRAHRRMSPPARDELHVLSVCDRALIPLLDELRDERGRRA